MQCVLLRLQKLNRRIDDLQFGGLKIVQDPEKYCFTTDSVLLANFFSARKNDVVVELCSGSGVISILGTKKTHAKEFHCFEIQPELSALCNESIKLNNLNNVFCHNMSLSKATAVMGKNNIDVVVVNPPYYFESAKSENPSIANATHEISTNLAEISKVSAQLLKFGGKFFMVHLASRFAEICHELKQNSLEPKIAVFVKPTQNKQVNLVLVEAVKNAKVGLKIGQIVLQNDDGSLTKQIQDVYSGKSNISKDFAN